MESTYYEDRSEKELIQILKYDYEAAELPSELRDVAADLLGAKAVSREITIGFLKFCDAYEEWIEATGGELVQNYISDTYDMSELDTLD